MLKSVTIVVAILFCSLSFSQNNTKGVVFYTQIESFYMGSRKGPDVLSCLVFNKGESYYVTKKDSLEKLKVTEAKEFYKNENGGGGAIYMGGISTSSHGTEVYTDFKKDSVWSNLRWSIFAYVKEKKVKINWQLLNETKRIGTFECYKAIGVYRGRKYTAWYTNEIPVPYGPWKLQGLPGLILEAYDTNEEVYFCMSKLEYPTKNPTPISKVKIEEGKKWLTYMEFLKWCDDNLQKTFEKGVLLKIDPIRSKMNEIFKEFSE